MIVVDASVVIGYTLDDENVRYADAAVRFLASKGGIVPGNFYSEVCEGLLRAERRRRLDANGVNEAIADINRLPLTVKLPDPLRALDLAREYRLSAYDAFYLALARETANALATTDSTLAAAAKACGLYWSL